MPMPVAGSQSVQVLPLALPIAGRCSTASLKQLAHPKEDMIDAPAEPFADSENVQPKTKMLVKHFINPPEPSQALAPLRLPCPPAPTRTPAAPRTLSPSVPARSLSPSGLGSAQLGSAKTGTVPAQLGSAQLGAQSPPHSSRVGPLRELFSAAESSQQPPWSRSPSKEDVIQPPAWYSPRKPPAASSDSTDVAQPQHQQLSARCPVAVTVEVVKSPALTHRGLVEMQGSPRGTGSLANWMQVRGSCTPKPPMPSDVTAAS